LAFFARKFIIFHLHSWLSFQRMCLLLRDLMLLYRLYCSEKSGGESTI